MRRAHRHFELIDQRPIAGAGIAIPIGDLSDVRTVQYFSILKRGIFGTFHHVSEAHLGRYLSEFDFRYNTRAKLGVDDTRRASLALKGVVGKRLTYETTGRARTAQAGGSTA